MAIKVPTGQFFQGGFAEQNNITRELGQRDRQLGQTDRRLDQQDRQFDFDSKEAIKSEVLARMDSVVGSTIEMMKDEQNRALLKNTKSGQILKGGIEKQIAQVTQSLKPMVQAYGSAGGNAGLLEQEIAIKLRQAHAALNPIETAQLEGKADAAGEKQRFTDLGGDMSKARVTASGLTEPEPQTAGRFVSGNVITLGKVDDKGELLRETVNANTPEGIARLNQLIDDDYTEVSTSVTGSKNDVFGLADKKIKREAINQLSGSVTTHRQINTVLDGIGKTQAFGIAGQAIDTFGGYVQQAFEAAGHPEKLAEMGIDLEEVAKLRTTSRTLLGRQIKSILGDESGRYSDFDVQYAQRTQKALDGSMSDKQIASSIKSLAEIETEADLSAVNTLAREMGLSLSPSLPDEELVSQLTKVYEAILSTGHDVAYAQALVTLLASQRGIE